MKVAEEKPESPRTDSQNDSMHLFFRQLAEILNDAGFSVQEILAEAMEIDWSEYRVKELLWRNAQKKLTGKQSTTELKKASGEIDKIHKHLVRHLGRKFGIEVPPFPYKCKTCEQVGCDNLEHN